jgi:hypothetical protein
MENTLVDSEHVVAALKKAGIKARSEETGGHVYVTYVDVNENVMLGITNESYGDDGWFVCRYDPRDFEDEGIVIGENIRSTRAVVELVRGYLKRV